MCGLPGLRSRRPDRPVVRGRHGHRHRRRRHAPPAAADHRRGDRAAGRAARAGRGARDGGHRGGPPGRGQDRERRSARPRRPGWRSGIAPPRRTEEATAGAVRAALDRGRALRIRYYTASRDVVTDRTVDPMRLLLVEGRSYLEAWCRSAEGVRLFRLDRIDDVAGAGRAGRPAARTPAPPTCPPGCSAPAPDQRVARLRVGPGGPLGRPSTTRWTRWSRPDGGRAGADALHRRRAGWSGWCSAWAGGPACWPRTSCGRRSARAGPGGALAGG